MRKEILKHNHIINQKSVPDEWVAMWVDVLVVALVDVMVGVWVAMMVEG